MTVSAPPHPRAPILPAALAESPTELRLTAETVLEELALDDADLSGTVARGVALRGVRGTTVRLADADLDGLELTDVALTGCDLANLRAPRAGWRRVSVERSRLTGLTLAGGHLRDLVIRDCRVDLASFAQARLTQVSFEDCALTQTDFLEAELDAVRFTDCDLAGVDLRGARLRRCELRGNRLEDVRGIEALRGAALRWTDIIDGAGLWARALGIEVLDDGSSDDQAGMSETS